MLASWTFISSACTGTHCIGRQPIQSTRRQCSSGVLLDSWKYLDFRCTRTRVVDFHCLVCALTLEISQHVIHKWSNHFPQSSLYIYGAGLLGILVQVFHAAYCSHRSKLPKLQSGCQHKQCIKWTFASITRTSECRNRKKERERGRERKRSVSTKIYVTFLQRSP